MSRDVRTRPRRSDSASSQAASSARTGNGPRGLLAKPLGAVTLAVATGFAVVAFAALALSTAMPVAAADLHGLSDYAAAFSALMAASLVGTIVSGDLCDAGLVRAVAAGSLGCFAAGAVVCGAAGGMGQLILGRALQGLGGGGLTVVLYVVVALRYPARIRPRVFSMITSCWVLPSLIGPAVAGTVATQLSWRWVFYGIAVFALGCAVPVLRIVPRDGAGAARDPEPRAGRLGRRTRTILAVTAAAGAGSIQFAEDARTPGICAAAAVAGLAALIVAVPRLLPRGTLRAAPGVPALVFLRGATAAAFFTVESFIPLLLIHERRFSATLAGFALTGSALTWTAASWYQGRPSTRVDRRRLIWIGTAVHCAGTVMALCSALPAAGLSAFGLAVTAPLSLAVSGFGMGLLLPSIGVLTMEQSADSEQGANSAALQLADSLASVLMVGVAGALFRAFARSGEEARSFFWALTPPVVTTAALVFVAPRVLRRPIVAIQEGEL